jgi:hypothetical protein
MHPFAGVFPLPRHASPFFGYLKARDEKAAIEFKIAERCGPAG